MLDANAFVHFGASPLHVGDAHVTRPHDSVMRRFTCSSPTICSVLACTGLHARTAHGRRLALAIGTGDALHSCRDRIDATQSQEAFGCLIA